MHENFGTFFVTLSFGEFLTRMDICSLLTIAGPSFYSCATPVLLVMCHIKLCERLLIVIVFMTDVMSRAHGVADSALKKILSDLNHLPYLVPVVVPRP